MGKHRRRISGPQSILHFCIQRYLKNTLSIIAETLPTIIQEITNKYRNKYSFDVNMKFHIFVGAFGSNAFVEREIMGDIFLR